MLQALRYAGAALLVLLTWTAESPMNNIEVFHFVQIRGQ